MNKQEAILELIKTIRIAKGIMNADEKQAVKQFIVRKNDIYISACGCMGPQNNEPLCPCAMKMVETVNGKYYRIVETPVDGTSIKYTATGLIV